MRVVVGILMPLCILPSILISGCARNAESTIEERITAVETGLPEFSFATGVPWNQVGHAPGTSSIYQRMWSYHVPGVSIAVIDDFAIDWARGYGELVAAGGDSVTTRTPFEAASTTKAATATAVFGLVSRGLLDLDDEVNQRLTSWQIPASEFTATTAITVRHLLTHTAGTNRPAGGFSIADDGSPSTLQVLNGESPATNAPLLVEFVPGTRHQYSNFGYVVLQQLLTDVTTRPFAQVMRETVFEPLGMHSSTFDQKRSDRYPEPRPVPHSPAGEPLESLPHPSALAQGGLWTTPTDLGRLAIELMQSHGGRSGGLVAPAVARLALDTRLAIDPAEHMGFAMEGLGLFILDTDRGPGFSHPGFNAPGATCMFIGFPDAGQGAVVMANGAGGLQLAFEVISSIAARYSWPKISAEPQG